MDVGSIPRTIPGRGGICVGLCLPRWRSRGAISGWDDVPFVTHAACTLGVIALIFVLFFGHRYEFQYIWKHLNNEMPMRFVLSAFWGGQEGGFLLWMFWHNVLALFILRRADAWQREVMTVLSAIEAFLGVMLLGIYFGDFQLGLDPFMLCARHPTTWACPGPRASTTSHHSLSLLMDRDLIPSFKTIG